MDKKELDITPENTTVQKETAEKVQDIGADTTEAVAEEVAENNEKTEEKAENEEKEVSVKEEIISEFAPAPINIPNYDKEKEMRKVQKANAKKKKQRSKKAKKRKRIIRKILVTVRTVMLFVLLFAVATSVIASLTVRMNTSEYSIENTIRDSNPELFVVGKIQSPEKINLKMSSSKASIIDILKDNSLLLVTYGEIKKAVDLSSYPSYVASVAHDIVRYYLYGEPVEKITASDLQQVLYDNASSYIKPITGIEIGESACRDMAKYIVESDAIKELSEEKLASQSAARYTAITSIAFSTAILLLLVVAFIALLVLVVIFCKGFWHKIIGGAIISAGAVVGVAGYLFKPAFIAKSAFVDCVLSAIVKGFNNSALIYAAVAVLIGVLVVLTGKALNDEDDEDYEYEYEQNA